MKGKLEAAYAPRVPHVLQLWQLVHVLDRAVVLSFLYAHSAQLSEFNIEYRYDDHGPTTPVVVRTELASTAGDYNPLDFRGFTGMEVQGQSNGGLLQLRKVFPGVVKVLDVCFLWQTQVSSCSSGVCLDDVIAMNRVFLFSFWRPSLTNR